MTSEDVGKRAEELFGKSGLHCAESVLKAVSELAGIDSPLIPKIATGFCGGMARTDGLCGAVSGGVMALSMIFGSSSTDVPADKTYSNVQKFLSEFVNEHGSRNCSELAGYDLSTADKCKVFVHSAASAAAEIIISGAPGRREGGGNCGSLAEVRENIDRIDREIVRLLSERGRFVKQAAGFKKSVEDVKAPGRVEEVIKKVRGLALAQNGNPDMVEQVYRTMIKAFIEEEIGAYKNNG